MRLFIFLKGDKNDKASIALFYNSPEELEKSKKIILDTDLPEDLTDSEGNTAMFHRNNFGYVTSEKVN